MDVKEYLAKQIEEYAAKYHRSRNNENIEAMAIYYVSRILGACSMAADLKLIQMADYFGLLADLYKVGQEEDEG